MPSPCLGTGEGNETDKERKTEEGTSYVSLSLPSVAGVPVCAVYGERHSCVESADLRSLLPVFLCGSSYVYVCTESARVHVLRIWVYLAMQLVIYLALLLRVKICRGEVLIDACPVQEENGRTPCLLPLHMVSYGC